MLSLSLFSCVNDDSEESLNPNSYSASKYNGIWKDQADYYNLTLRYEGDFSYTANNNLVSSGHSYYVSGQYIDSIWVDTVMIDTAFASAPYITPRWEFLDSNSVIIIPSGSSNNDTVLFVNDYVYYNADVLNLVDIVIVAGQEESSIHTAQIRQFYEDSAYFNLPFVDTSIWMYRN